MTKPVNSNQIWVLGALAVAALAALFLLSRPTSVTADQENSVKQPAPAWELKDVDGKTVKLSDFKDKVVILDFWATWCPPCRAEIPGFVELQKEYKDKGLVIVGVSMDEEGAAVVKPFIKRFKMNYPVVLATPEVIKAYGGVEAIPTTFIIDREGRIVRRHIGYAEKSEFENEIKPLLKS